MKRPVLSPVVGHILMLGLVGGVLIAVLRWCEYEFLVLEHSVQIYGALIAIIFAAVGVWLGVKLGVRVTAPRTEADKGQASAGVAEVGFLVNQTRLGEVGITPRELEILGLVAEGLSNREIAGRIFVSENTVKTHCSRTFDKLGARRRTQAVQRGKEFGLIP